MIKYIYTYTKVNTLETCSLRGIKTYFARPLDWGLGNGKYKNQDVASLNTYYFL